MPELPEVEVVRAGLAPAITGATVSSVEVFDARSLRRHDPAAGDFAARLTGQRFTAAVRRGKFLWLPLAAPTVVGVSAVVSAPTAANKTTDNFRDTPVAPLQHPARRCESPSFSALLVHLGMSGQVLLREPGARLEDDGPVRIRLVLQHPEHGELAVHFVDQRIFGSMAVDRLVDTPDAAPGGFGDSAALVPSQVAHIARDPLDPAFSDAAFLASLQRKNTGIKRALLDQTLISGIGNIYADEALWAARVHFAQPTASLSSRKARAVLTEVRLVLAKALAEGGTSFDAHYVNVNGASGYFSHSLNAYGQQGKPCPRCGRPMVREAFMNRSSHFCPHCQRLRVPRLLQS
ncbi:bifunctional DNA-formamidopyrimidine glycosylase/DNA-(apurinic or apyrimidinic site) lyase [Rathayibacter soli]|uniref:bifunctional DNA-formamidopyrimidine glycosylase/DNA-(apurinic or apyrimidinic site) lyase n=1 Tax=Rathayibacter soli TaxID=3144168 RepID=UPI0027E451A6|nr:bifunctional DNA-formamidopyrimidine glycosylase/DNA-(apurinic or apyrimidinic site) lyase [Glaciibacter superstes]